MKRVLITLFVLTICTQLFAEPMIPESIMKRIADLVRRATVDFPDRRGSIVTDNDELTLYRVTAPHHYMLNDNQFISVLKKNKQAFYITAYSGDNEIDVATRAFTGFGDPYQRYWKFEKANYSAKHSLQKNGDGYLTDTLFYKTIPVAVLNVSGNTAVITVGIFNSKNLAAEKALLPQMLEQPYTSGSPFEHMTVNGTVITVHGWGKDFDGDYDTAILAKDSCVSGDCNMGKGRKVLASISNGQPRIRIMQGKFRNSVFLGNGVMLVDGENPAYDGTYEIGSFDYDYTHNFVGAKKAVFHTKAGNETFKGDFDGYLDYGIGKAVYTYQKFVVCKFNPQDTSGVISPWIRDALLPQKELEEDAFMATAQYRMEEAKADDDRAEYARQTAYNQQHDKCGCCGGKGVITQQDFIHYQGSGNNYMRYSSVTCTCCGGTGLKKDQTSYKPQNNGTVILR